MMISIITTTLLPFLIYLMANLRQMKQASSPHSIYDSVPTLSYNPGLAWTQTYIRVQQTSIYIDLMFPQHFPPNLKLARLGPLPYFSCKVSCTFYIFTHARTVPSLPHHIKLISSESRVPLKKAVCHLSFHEMTCFSSYISLRVVTQCVIVDLSMFNFLTVTLPTSR